MATITENYRRAVSRLRKKAYTAISDWRGPLGHPQDLVDFERFAEAEQLAAYRLHGMENVESGQAWQT